MVLSESISRQIVDCLVPVFNPRKIIVFGSYASGAATPDSDIDIMVLVDPPLASKRAAKKDGYLALFDIGFSVDFLIESTDEFEVAKKVGSTVEYEVFKNGVCIYES
jgi:uncharacterized protein